MKNTGRLLVAFAIGALAATSTIALATAPHRRAPAAPARAAERRPVTAPPFVDAYQPELPATSEIDVPEASETPTLTR